MRDLSIGLAILLTHTLTSPALADYILQLKNGRTVETPRCWEEKGEIKFQWPGGVASLPRNDLLTILEVKEKFPAPSPNREKRPPPENPETLPGNPPAKGNIEGKGFPAERPSSADSPREVSVEYYRKQKAYYMERFDRAYRRYLEASSRRDAEGKKKAWEEFNRFGGQVIALETELKKKNQGTVPSWWKEEKTKEEKSSSPLRFPPPP